jgi:hypothetical protein
MTSANVGYAMGRLQYAEQVMYRQQLFEQAIGEAEREMAKITDAEKEDADVREKVATFQAAVDSLRAKYRDRERKEKYDELERRAKARWNDINNFHWPRFPDRTQTALGEINTAYVRAIDLRSRCSCTLDGNVLSDDDATTCSCCIV